MIHEWLGFGYPWYLNVVHLVVSRVLINVVILFSLATEDEKRRDDIIQKLSKGVKEKKVLSGGKIVNLIMLNFVRLIN